MALARVCGFCLEPTRECLCEIETPPAAPPPIECPACRDTSYTCEHHPDRPWGVMCCDGPVREDNGVCPGEVLCEHGACHCCGGGRVCPACRPDLPLEPVRWVARVIDPDGERM